MGCGSSTNKVADESAIVVKGVVPQPESPQSIVPTAPDIAITQTNGQQETASSPPSPEPSSPRLRLQVPSISIVSNEARYHENSVDHGEEVNDAAAAASAAAAAAAAAGRPEGQSPASSRDPSPSSPVSRQASRRSSQAEGRLRSPSKASVRSSGSHGSHLSHLSVPQTQDSRRASTPDQSSQASPAGEQDAVAELLGKAVLHSGSLMQETMRVQALQGCETLSEAIQTMPRPDNHMPNFDMKVDPENMLLKLPHDIFKPNQLSLQRVSFMGTKWIALRLCTGSRAQCMKFCMVAASLQNIGRNTSRSVVVEACEASPMNNSKVPLDIPGFVCAPIPRDAVVSTTVSWLDIWHDVSETAEIIINEASLPEKKVTAELKKWVVRVGHRFRDAGSSKTRFSFLSAISAPTAPASPKSKGRSMSESQIPEFGNAEAFRDRSRSEADLENGQSSGALSSVARWVKDRISLNGVFSSLEDQLASLTPAPEASSPRSRRNLSSGGRISPRSRDDKGESRKSSKSSTGSNGRRRPSHASSSDTDIGPDSGRNSTSSSAGRRRSCSWPGPLSDDGESLENANTASPSSSSPSSGAEPEPSSLMRRKSFSHIQMMPVLHEGAQDLSEKNSEDEDEDPKNVDDEEDDKEASPPQSVSGQKSPEQLTD